MEKTKPGITLMRFNGEWVPQSVVGRIPSDRVAPGVTRFKNLPAGTYEFWTVAPSPDDKDAFAPPARPPVRVGLSGGEQRIEVPLE